MATPRSRPADARRRHRPAAAAVRKPAPAARKPAAAVRKPTSPQTLHRLRALAHPLRQRLLLLFARERLTTKQAAGRLGESPTKLYHHVAALERAGLVALRETRPNRGTIEKYYETTTRSVLADRNMVQSPGARQTMNTLLFEEARRDLLATLDAGPGAWDTPPVAFRLLTQLTPAQAKALRREILALIKRFRAIKRGSGPAGKTRRAYAFTAVFAPIAGEKGR